MSIRSSVEKQQKWNRFIEEQRVSGISVEKWCTQNQVNRSTFLYWKSKLFPKSLKRTHFTELHFKETRRNPILLQAQGISIRINEDCDLHLRKQLFALFAEVSC